jgi:hypothetical protein
MWEYKLTVHVPAPKKFSEVRKEVCRHYVVFSASYDTRNQSVQVEDLCI